ncbi:MAG: hypothetical protein ACQEQV_00965 [Fibrobacterota bacterium]
MNILQKCALFLTVITAAVTGSEDKLLVFQNSGTSFDKVYASMQQELQADFSLVRIYSDDLMQPSEMANILEKHAPDLVVLMDNNNIRSYRNYISGLTDSANILPSLSLMGAFVNKEIEGMPRAVGISYEIPIVTSVMNLRSILETDTIKLGIVYREFLQDFIARNRKYCEAEGINLQTYYVPENEDQYTKFLKVGLRQLAEKDSVNTIWVPNDKVFLSPSAISNIWIPFSEKYDINIIVGVTTFLLPDIDFGTFAVVPDLAAMGQQAADMVYTLKAQNWKAATQVVEPPISIFKMMNMDKFESPLDSSRIYSIDSIVE